MAVWSKIKASDLIEPNRFDSEYFKPEYLKIRNKLEGYSPLKYFIKRITHPGEFKRIYSYKGITVIRAQNVRPLSIELTNNEIFVSPERVKNLTQNIVENGDILITRTGANFGQATLYTGERENAIVTSHTFILKINDKIDSAYLALYLNTHYGRKLLDQGMYGSSQPEIAPKAIKDIPIPRFSIALEKKVSDSVRKSYKLRKESLLLYQRATQLLEQELELDKIQFKKQKSFAANFSEVVTNNRSDADYYQIKYRQLESHLNSIERKFLGSICTFQKGFEVGSALYAAEGPLFIRISNLTKDGFSIGNSDKYITNDTYNLFKVNKPRIGDILLTKDGTIGTCYVVDEEIEGIISGGILKLNMIDENIPEEYLALVINSKICQMQAQRDCSGALILHWKAENIRKLKIPILDKKIMLNLSELVIQSKKARKESIQLLEQAKTEMENLIEQAANK
jgi:type I restriction enzyme S subunit/type I restriction enzyme M protein